MASVLDGSIQRKGNRLRVTVRLINVADGSQLWSERFDEPQDDVFAVQDSIADRVIGALALRLTDSDRRRMDRYRTRDAQANHLYVLGRGLCISRRAENLDRGIEYLGGRRPRSATHCCTPPRGLHSIRRVRQRAPLPLFARSAELPRGAGARPRSGGAHAPLTLKWR